MVLAGMSKLVHYLLIEYSVSQLSDYPQALVCCRAHLDMIFSSFGSKN